MNRNSLQHEIVNKQDDSLMKYELERFLGDDVFCPMCEIFHVNNTMCQANLFDQGEIIW